MTTWTFQQFKQTPPTNLIYYSSFIIFNYVFPIFISLVKNSKLNLENGFNLFSTWVVIHEQSSLLGAILELKWKQYLEDGASFFLLNFSCLKFLSCYMSILIHHTTIKENKIKEILIKFSRCSRLLTNVKN